MGQKIVKKKIGELLIEAEKLTQENLDKALERQKNTDKKLGEILVELELVTEEDLIVQLAVQYQYPFINISQYEIPPDILGLIPKGLAMKYFCLPMDRIGNMISFVVSDPGNLYDLKQQESFLNCKMQFFVTTPSLLRGAMKKYYGVS